MAAVHMSPPDPGPVTTPAAIAPAPAATPGPYESGLQQQQMTPPQHHPRSSSQGSTPQNQPQNPHQLQQQSQSQSQSQHPRSVKRPRPVKSCTECRKRKLRCDRLLPCSQCQKSARACRYAAEHDSANLSDDDDGEMPDPGRPSKRACVTGPSAGSAAASGEGAAYAPPKDPDAVGFNTVAEELFMRMDRLEKQVRVRSPPGADFGASRMMAAPARTIRGVKIKSAGMRTRFYGQNSPRVMLNLFEDAKDFLDDEKGASSAAEIKMNFKKLHNVLQAEYKKSLAPITVFVDSMMPVRKRMTDILPKKPVCDRLVNAYLDSAETVCRIIHLPTFFDQYNQFWDGNPQSEFFLPQLLSVLSVGSRFDTRSSGFGHERSEGVHIPTAVALIRAWLDGLKGKQLVEVGVLQVELLLLLAQKIISSRYQDSWAQLGYIVRMAMTMGLHRDPSESGRRISVFNGEIRRRLWYSVVDLDVQLSLDCNLPCLTRDGDFSCRPPRNLDDADLFPEMGQLPPAKPIDQFTDTQGQAFTASLLTTRMRVTHLVNRVDNVRDYQEILEVGSRLESFLEDVNMIFPRNGITNRANRNRIWRTRVMIEMQVRRPLLALYRPFALEAPAAPSQIPRVYLRSCMAMFGYPDELDATLAYHEGLVDSYHQLFKYDLIQAAMSILYFIRCLTQPTSDGMAMSHHALRMSPDRGDDNNREGPSGIQIFSVARLVSIVENMLEVYIRTIHRSDTKAIVALSTILEMVKTPAPKPEAIAQSMRSVLERCMRAANVNLEKLNVQQSGVGTGPSPASLAGPSNPFQGYLPGRMPFGFPDGGQSMPTPDFEGWVMWEGWE